MKSLFRDFGDTFWWSPDVSNASNLEAILNQAMERERDYDWLDAVEFYERAFSSLPETDFLKRGQIQERIGHCFCRAAFQAESQAQFKERIELAIEAYEKAHRLYEELTDEPETSRMFRCNAIVKYLEFWLESDPAEKRGLLDECLELEDKALTVFSDSKDVLEYGRTYSELWMVFWLRSLLEWNRETTERIVGKGKEWGEKAIVALSELDCSHELAWIYCARAFLSLFDVSFITEPDQQLNSRLEAIKYLSKAISLAEKIGDALLLGWSHLRFGWQTGLEMLRHLEKASEFGAKTRDNFLIAASLDVLAHNTFWRAIATEDPEKRKELAKTVMRLDEKCQRHYSIISFTCPTTGVIRPASSSHTEVHWFLANDEIGPEKRLELLEAAEKIGLEDLKLAKDLDIPRVVCSVFHDFSKALQTRAQADSDAKEKRSRLEKALEYREKNIEMIEQLEPFNYWDRGIGQNYLAEIKAELAEIESDFDKKEMLLEEAVSSKEKCLRLCNKTILHWGEGRGETEIFAVLQRYQSSFATILLRLYNLTDKEEYLRKAIAILLKAIESAGKLDMVSRSAESYWKIAKAFDILGEHLKAAENFKHASESYKKAAEKVPQLSDLYRNHAFYMEAWSEIEKARHCHRKQEYGRAKQHFEKAAEIHKSLEPWSYMAPNYSAWALVEHAEELSRNEQSEEALQAFEQAAQMFKETEKTLQIQLNKIDSLDEKQVAINIAEATDARREYCVARITLEEAKILDRKGDHYSSSEKYGSATSAFQKITQTLESEQDIKELKLIISLSRAWQKMTQAEAEASPALYMEASQLFEEAKELSPSERAKMLALGHSRFCRALETGTKFADTRDATLHAIAVQHLEIAASYYLKAGFQNASEYAKAMEHLFDAYLHVDDAKKERSPEKKARLYAMAEKVLQSAAEAFTRAEHPEKREQVMKLLEKVKEERELATSLSEILHAPTIVSATTTFSTPTPTHESAVGLERFEHANIQAHLATPEEATLGEEFEIRLDLVNVGKEPALLVSVEELVPPAFKITKTPPNYNIEDHTLDVKGKRLEPQKVESIKILAKATKTGVTTLCPQITYVDELGKFHTHKPEAVQNTILPPTEFQFKTENAQKVFEYLTKAFVEDYMKRRLTQEKSGWRTLMQVVKAAKISKKSVYGTTTRKGSAIGELEGRGVVELRMFLGERGRGGEITKVRIAYEKDTIKRHIDQQVMKAGGK